MTPNNDTPNARPLPPPVQQPIARDQTGHVQRPLPHVKTAAESIAKRAEVTGDKSSLVEQDPKEAAATLLKYNDEVLNRLAEVAEYFKSKSDKLDPKIDPTKARSFTDFVRDHLAYINMRFVTLGRFDRPGVEDPNTKTGFEPIREKSDNVDPGLDPMLRTMRSAALAMQNGADLTGANTSAEEPA